MTAECDPVVGRVLELWVAAFGEPPSIVVEPDQMLALIEAHFADQRAHSCIGREARI